MISIMVVTCLWRQSPRSSLTREIELSAPTLSGHMRRSSSHQMNLINKSSSRPRAMVDWFVVVVAVVCVGLISYVCWLYLSPAQSDLPLNFHSLAVDDAVSEIEMSLFTAPFTQAREFESVREQNDIESKAVASALLSRAIAAVERAYAIQLEMSKVKRIHDGGMLTQTVADDIAAGNKAMDQEMKAIQSVANEVRPGWGASIIQQSVQLSIGLRQKQLDRKRAAEKALEERQRTARETEEARVAAERAASAATRRKAEEDAAQQRVADRAYAKLMEQEAKQSSTATNNNINGITTTIGRSKSKKKTN